MSDNFWRIHKGLNFTPQTSTPLNPLSGDFWYDSATSKFLARVAAVSDPIVTEAANQALTNKTFNASLNTLSNIVDSNISSSAAIVYSKLSLALSIINTDIAVAAAIDGTKILPDFGVQNITTSGSLALKKGTDFSTTGQSDNIATNNLSLFRYTGAGIATFTGFANGIDGKFLTIMNASSFVLLINDNDSSSSASNRVRTGTGAAISLSVNETILLQYDSGSSFWKVVGRAGGGTTEVVPIASITSYAGSTAPSSWMLCDGTAIDRVTFSTLFSIIGTTYGIGDGFSTFNLPDLRGRLVIALDNMGGTPANRITDPQADTLGGFMGEESHQLTTAEGPTHSHTVSASGSTTSGTTSVDHYHNENMGNANVGQSAWYQDNTGGGNLTIVNNEDTTESTRVTTEYSAVSTAHNHSVSLSVSGTTNATATATAHNNLQPSFALNYIIKVF